MKRKQEYSEANFDCDGNFDLQQTIEERELSGRQPTQYQAPGADQKWRARNLVDIYWVLTGIKTPSESYNRILSCIIDHANPKNGICYPRQSTIAIETGYSIETVKRAIRWWIKQSFLKTESRGLGHALAYHPQWDLLESFWIGVTADINEQKVSKVIKGTYAKVIKGTYGEGHHGDLHNLKAETSKKKPHPERAHATELRDAKVISMDEKRGIQRREVESLSTDFNLPEGPTVDGACNIVSGYCEGFHWDNLTEDDFQAAVDDELRESGDGHAVVNKLAVRRAKEKGATNE